MMIEEVHDYYWRNWQKAMRELGMGKNAYQYWQKRGYIPLHTQYKIEKLTGGQLKADIGHYAGDEHGRLCERDGEAAGSGQA